MKNIHLSLLRGKKLYLFLNINKNINCIYYIDKEIKKSKRFYPPANNSKVYCHIKTLTL